MSERSTQDRSAAVQALLDKYKRKEFQLSEEQVELLAAFLAECSNAEDLQLGSEVLGLVPDFGAENALALVGSPAFFVAVSKFQETVGALPVLDVEMNPIRQQFSCLQALQCIVHPNEKNVMRAFLKMISGHQEISDALLRVCGLEGIENSTSTLIQDMKIELLLSIYAAIVSAPLGAKIRESGLLPDSLVEALKGRSAAELLSESNYRGFINDINTTGSKSKIKSFRFVDFCRLQGNSSISTPKTVGWVDFCATTFSVYFEESKQYCDLAYATSTDYNYSGADKKLVFKVESMRRANEHLAVSDTDIKGPLEFSMVFANKTECKSAFEVTKLRSKEMEEILQAVNIITKPRKLAVVSSKKAPEAPDLFSSSSMTAAMVVDNNSKLLKGGKGVDHEESDPAECITSPEPTSENGNSTLHASSAANAAAAGKVAVARPSKEVMAKPDVARKGPKPASSVAAIPAVKSAATSAATTTAVAATAATETPNLHQQSSSKKKNSSSAAKENLPDTSSGAGNAQSKKRSMSRVDKSEPPSSPTGETSARMRKKQVGAGREDEQPLLPQSRSASSGKSRIEAQVDGKLLKVDSAPVPAAVAAVSTAPKPKREKRARDDENTLNAVGGKGKGKDKDEDKDEVEVEGAPSKISRSHARRDARKTDDEDPEVTSPAFLQENSQTQSDETSFDMTFSGIDYDFGGSSNNNDDEDDEDGVTDIEIIFATIVEKLQSIQTQREIHKAKKLMVEGTNHASRQVDEFLKRWVGMHTADIASKQATLLSNLGTFRALVEQLNASINVDILHFESKVSEARAESERIRDAHKVLQEEIEAYNKSCAEEDKRIKKGISTHRVSVAGSFETSSNNSLLPHFADDR